MDSTTRVDRFASKLTERIAAFQADNSPAAFSEEDFTGLALEAFGLQYKTNAAYRSLCQARRVRPETIKCWEEIPAVPAAAFKELELSSLQPQARTRVFYSSGTSQQRPSRHFHNARSLEVYEASLLAWFRPNFLPEARAAGSPILSPLLKTDVDKVSDKVYDKGQESPEFLFLTPSAAEAPYSSLVHMFETIRRAFGSAASAFLGEVAADGSWDLAAERAVSQLSEAAVTGKPVALLGTAFSFVHLLDYRQENDLRLQLPRGSRVLETGGYKGRSRALPKSELHSLINFVLGIPATHLVSEYGMSELSSQAYDRTVGGAPRAERIFRFPPWARAQIISPETGLEVDEGEAGLVRLFDLANVYSAVAIQTEDLAIRRRDGFEFLGRAALAEQRGCSLMAAH